MSRRWHRLYPNPTRRFSGETRTRQRGLGRVSPTPAARRVPAGEAPEAVTRSIRSVVQTVRVELSRLDALMNLVGELRVLQGDVARGLDGRDGGLTAIQQRELRAQTRQMARKIDALRDRILDVRMVPVGQMFDTLARVVRKISREHGKDVRLTVSGEQTELDKLIVEGLSDPLMHMIEAIDHGIETVEERSALGKPLTGRVGLHARQRELRRDRGGRRRPGDARSDIRTKAVARGLVPRETAEMMTPKEALGLIFTPGFSTSTGSPSSAVRASVWTWSRRHHAAVGAH